MNTGIKSRQKTTCSTLIVMVREMIITRTLILAMLCFLISVQLVEGAPASDQIKQAALRRICYDAYWWGEPVTLAKTTSIETVQEGERFLVWIDDLWSDEQSRMAGFYEGILKGDRAVVTRVEEYNAVLSPPIPGYTMNR